MADSDIKQIPVELPMKDLINVGSSGAQTTTELLEIPPAPPSALLEASLEEAPLVVETAPLAVEAAPLVVEAPLAVKEAPLVVEAASSASLEEAPPVPPVLSVPSVPQTDSSPKLQPMEIASEITSDTVLATAEPVLDVVAEYAAPTLLLAGGAPTNEAEDENIEPETHPEGPVTPEEWNHLAFAALDKYFDSNPYFVSAHHIDSYDQFIRQDMTEIIKQRNPIRKMFTVGKGAKRASEYPYEFRMYVGGRDGTAIYAGRPTMDAGELSHPMFPNEARTRRVTYAAPKASP